jgi:hypothetical protein
LVIAEPATGTIDAVFTINLSETSAEDVIVGYKAYDGAYEGDSPATGGSDYVATAGSVRIPAGRRSATITVPIIGDGVEEGIEYFQIILNSTSSNAVVDSLGGYSVVEIRDSGTVKNWIGPASGGSWTTAANWTPSGVPDANDVVTISGKLVSLSASTTIATLTLNGGASLTLASNGSQVFQSYSLNIAGAGSKLDLKNNKLIVSGGDVGAVTALVASGRNGGTWNGSGIVTSSASGNLTSLGIAEVAGDVVVKFTYAGDANLDGAVDTLDFNSLAANFGGTGKSWSKGDFNYDEVIDTLDFNTLAAQFGQTLAPEMNLTSTAAAESPRASALFSSRVIRDGRWGRLPMDLTDTDDAILP